jgi:hypothetical protein
MNRPDARISRLQALAGLVLDQRLAELRVQSERRERTRMQLAALDRPAEVAGLDPIVASPIALRYQVWADRRREEANLVLARQTADWLLARDEARKAMGRVEALRNIEKRMK